MQKKKNILAIAAILILGLCLLGCWGIGVLVRFSPNIYQYTLENSSLQVGMFAPDFELPTLTGEKIRLSQFRGKPVLLSFGATWCPDCRVEVPLLETLHKSQPELTILLVDSKESSGTVQKFVDNFGITQPVLLDHDGKIMELYQVFAIPTELFIDKEGIIRAKIIEKVTPQLLAKNLPLIGLEP